jgi:putative transposase
VPRRPRVLIEGGVHHVYNRFGSGERAFADPEEAMEFVDLLRFVKARDGWTIFAWVLMSNHYHLAIRSGAVPISRGLQYLQGRFSQRFNARRRRNGALWQSRYQAKPINQQRYLDQVILYIHLNPVAGGLVEDPKDHAFGGHREIAKRLKDSVVDMDACLLSFGERVRPARKRYLASIRAGCRELGQEHRQLEAMTEVWCSVDRELVADESGPYVDQLGRSLAPERVGLSAEGFIARSAAFLDLDPEDLGSSSRRSDLVEARRMIVALGRERWALRTKDLASALHKSADTITYIQRQGVRLRLVDDGFRSRLEDLDRALIEETCSDQ